MGKFINKKTGTAFLLGGAVVGAIVHGVWYVISKEMYDDIYKACQDHVQLLTDLYMKQVGSLKTEPSTTETVENPEVKA